MLLGVCPCMRSADDEDPLTHLRTGHPRLLFTDSQLAEAKEAARSDPLRAATHARIVASAEGFLKAPPLVHKLIGPRLLDQSRAAIQRIVTSAMAFRLTGDVRFAERARYDLRTVAAFPDWNPSHFLDVAELSFAFGIGYDWLYHWLPPADRVMIHQALLEKSLVFARPAYAPGRPADKRLFFSQVDHNWNQVCNGGLLTAALALADEEPELARIVINGARATLPKVMARYQPDGAYPEGPGYWAYGTTYNVIALAEMESALGTDFGLGRAPAFDRTALYRLAVEGPFGLGFNYADGGAHLEDSPAYGWLAQRYQHPAAIHHSRALLASLTEDPKSRASSDRFLALYAAWYVPEETAAEIQAPLDWHFRGTADIAVFRSAWNDPRALYIGFKGGSNTANHAHLDLGSFVLDADGVRWAVDLGPDDYNLPEYFGRKRWSYFRLNNRSHNTLTPGDQLQDPKGTASIVAWGSAPNRSFSVADLTSVYPGVAERVLRGLELLDRSRVLVQDEISSPAKGLPFHWTMMTGAGITVGENGRSALLSQSGRSLRADLLSPANASFHVESAQPPTKSENQNAGMRLLACEVSPADHATTRIVVVLSPEGARWGAHPPPGIVPLSDWPHP